MERELVIAAKNGNKAVVQELMAAGAYVNSKDISDKQDKTALMFAAEYGHLEVVIELIKDIKVELNLQNNHGMTALMLAIQNGHVKIAIKLLEDARSEINLQDTYGRSALMLAAQYNYLEVVTKLMKEAKAEVNLQDKGGMTALMRAASNLNSKLINALRISKTQINLQDDRAWAAHMSTVYRVHLEVLNVLIAAGAKINLQDNEGKTALIHLLSYHSRWNRKVRYNREWYTVADPVLAASKLIAAGAKINLQDNEGKTALMLAARSGYSSTASVLIDAGAKVNLQDVKGDNALVYFVIYAKRDPIVIVNKLIEAKAEVNQKRYNNWTALMYAVYRGYAATVDALITAGANVNLQDEKGKTMLMYLIMYVKRDSLAIVDKLLEAGTDVNLQDANGKTALMYAANYFTIDPPSIVSKLIEAGTNVNLRDKEGDTALMYAAENSRVVNVEALIAAGAEVNLQNKDGKTALIKAATYGYLRVVDTLINSGADINLQDKDGSTALIYLTKYYRAWAVADPVYTVAEFIEAGAKVNLQNKDGITALMYAAQNGYTATMYALLRAGALINIRDSKGATVFAYASHRQEILEFLLEELPTKEKRFTKTLDALKVALRQPELFSEGIDNLVASITKRHSGMQKDWNRFMLAAYLGDEDLITYLSDAAEERAEMLTKEDSNGDNYIVIAAKAGQLEFVENMLTHELAVHRENNAELLINTMQKINVLAAKASPLAVLINDLQKTLNDDLKSLPKFGVDAKMGAGAGAGTSESSFYNLHGGDTTHIASKTKAEPTAKTANPAKRTRIENDSAALSALSSPSAYTPAAAALSTPSGGAGTGAATNYVRSRLS